MKPWLAADIEELRRLWAIHGGGFKKIAALMGRTAGSISGKSRLLGLQFQSHGRPRILDAMHPAMINMTTVHRGTIRSASPDFDVLQSGDNQRKLGKWVTKGKWKGFPIFSLTLVERETCPSDCKQLSNCFGNVMGLAKRYKFDDALLDRIAFELSRLQYRYPKGFVVRLHLLGDFPSMRYLSFWHICLDCFPALRIFGYTHWQRGTKLGDAIHELRQEQWHRFAIRTSDAPRGPRTVTIEHAQDKRNAIICPAQQAGGETRQCGSCALCWSPTIRHRPIAFLLH